MLETRIDSWPLIVLALCAVVLTSCAGTIAPRGWLGTPEENQRTAFGGWVRLETMVGELDTLEGELIAVQKDSIFILRNSGRLESYSAGEIKSVHLQSYDPKLGTLTLWTLSGAASTISHGFILIISLPVWIATGSLSGAAVSAAAHEKLGPDGWESLTSYARFPQGLPVGLDRAVLLPKPQR